MTSIRIVPLVIALLGCGFWPGCDRRAGSQTDARQTNTKSDSPSRDGKAFDVAVGDAYAKAGRDGRSWSIGTAGIEMTFQVQQSRFVLASFQNKTVKPAQEYVAPAFASAPFRLTPAAQGLEEFKVQAVWEKYLPNPATADPAADKLALEVKKGEMIGFAVGPHGDYTGDMTQWPVTLEYKDGTSYASKDDAKLDQGPIWFYYINKPGTGLMWPIDAIVPNQPVAQEPVRIPSPTSSFRAPGDCPMAGATMMHPSNDYDAVRVWCAPKDGTVTVRGQAAHLRGTGNVDLRILRINRIEKPTTKPAPDESAWTVNSANTARVVSGGRPAVQLDFVLTQDDLRARLHVLAFPGTSILRQWLEVENSGKGPLAVRCTFPFISMQGRGASPLTSYWLEGGPPSTMQSAPVTPAYHHLLEGHKTRQSVPWMAFQQGEAPNDGWFLALDYLGGWDITAAREAAGPLVVTTGILDLVGRPLTAGERLVMPMVTLGAFGRDFDDLMERVYAWQYQYLWDYTSDEWYGRIPFCGSDFYTGAVNSQENFAGRLGWLDMDTADLIRSNGMELLWDDAGWSESADCWQASQEGPDFGQTMRYLDKMGMKMALWVLGRPQPGLMDGKVGAWGNIQWRTDSVGNFDFASDASWRQQIAGFLRKNPGSSFHTCDGGSGYSHTFDMQRYAEISQFSDAGRGDETNHYLSYIEIPDRWLELVTGWNIIQSVRNTGSYDPYSYAQILTMVPSWITPGPSTEQCDPTYTRRITELYRYLRREGVVGRWSYMFHPAVKGDAEKYYAQRTNYDRRKALIIPKHKAPDGTVVYPRGLLSEENYIVGFESVKETTTRTGADLMANGIVLAHEAPKELIYFGLPNHPGSGADKQPPKAPGRVLVRRETNIGHTGIGVYWSPGANDNWISYYEVRRGERILDKVATGLYYFDHAPGWDAGEKYSVRTVGGDGNVSPWTAAEAFSDEALAYSALGGHSAEKGREGWSAETTTDERTFTDMNFVRPAKEPFVDYSPNFQANVNQVGGLEGYWEGTGGAQVGRGWQRASTAAECVRTWTAPRAGTVRIVGRAMKEYHTSGQGGPLSVRILHGVTPVWPGDAKANVPVGDLYGLAHDISLNVAAGDKIRFVLGRGTAPATDVLVWMPRIVYADTAGKAPPEQAVRILCGAKSPCTDKLGNVWSADRFFAGGSAILAARAIADAEPTPGDQALYQAGREGKDFTYAIPVPPGLYAVRLKFAETKYGYSFERPMNLSINGREVLHNFDACQAARGPMRACERVFRYLVPDAEGRLVLHFTGAFEPTQLTDQAMVQAIEVLPEIKPAIRVDCGSAEDFVDWNGFIWGKDAGFDGGQVIASPNAASQASPTLYDRKLYQAARTGKSFGYSFVLPPGMYTVHLKFAELWNAEPGKRPMNIDINGRRVRENFDPATAAGQMKMAADVRVEDVTPDKDSKIAIRVTSAGATDAILQGIEIE